MERCYASGIQQLDILEEGPAGTSEVLDLGTQQGLLVGRIVEGALDGIGQYGALQSDDIAFAKDVDEGLVANGLNAGRQRDISDGATVFEGSLANGGKMFWKCHILQGATTLKDSIANGSNLLWQYDSRQRYTVLEGAVGHTGDSSLEVDSLQFGTPDEDLLVHLCKAGGQGDF